MPRIFSPCSPVAATLREPTDNDIENSCATFVDKAQDQGIKAVRAGASREDHKQHEGIEELGQIEPIVDPVCFVDRLVEIDSLRSRCSDGDQDDYEQAKRGERCNEPDHDSETGGELDCWHPPLVKAQCVNAKFL